MFAEQTPVAFPPSPQEFLKLTPTQVREQFLVERLFVPDALKMQFTNCDRLAVGGAVPVSAPLPLKNSKETGCDFFLARRELGTLNIGGAGWVEVDGNRYEVGVRECLYVGKDSRDVLFGSNDPAKPARFALFSAPAHKTFPTALVTEADIKPVHLGASGTSNDRIIRKCIFADGVQSCNLVMGYTSLAEGSVWNSFPTHTHTRRSEIYLYFDLPGDRLVAHFAGQPDATRHIFVRDEEAVLSPPWSVHFGCGTGNYRFIWAMAGENLTYDDMDPAPPTSLR
ncbi:MAG: 5-dehydro-4-deoxy-D-glucuronate isomerase [Puniceicoccales bacterium]|jgi:4-deoxy-L-threo-5-hexosulose-uronate ketol-isomerase|nr:5-dehydro-4-deoxy-D-glucuronate isomerase [Puniceicoccales bacterium]